MTDDPQIRLVLDASAIVAYATDRVSVGEVICQLDDEPDAVFAVPDWCLIDAAARLPQPLWPMVDLLLSHAQCVRLGTPAGWRDVAATAVRLGSVGRAVALWWAVEHDCWVVSREPDGYGDDADSVIEV